jgi:hypothetical protein
MAQGLIVESNRLHFIQPDDESLAPLSQRPGVVHTEVFGVEERKR